MKIFVSALCFDGGKSGISEYIRCLSAALEKRTKTVVAILRKDVPHFGVVGDNVELLILPNVFSWVGLNVLLHCLLVPLLCRLRCVDACILPAANRRLTLWKTVPTVGIVHDLSQYHVDRKYDIWRTLYVKFVLPRFLAVLDDIICISETTKTDVVKFWHVDEDRISVIHNGYNSTLYNNSDNSTDDKIIRQYDLNDRYLIYVSRIEHPGKNHSGLISAFEKIANASAEVMNLVLVGSDWTGAELVREQVSKSPFSSQIKMLGFVPSAHFPALYRRAECMVFPSFYEGFGMPLLEAMACGTPVCASSAPSLIEVAGGAALHFDPEDVNRMREVVASVMSDESLRTALSTAGLTRVKQFDWSKLADKVMGLFMHRRT